MGKKTTIEIEFPPDLTIRDAMRIMYHTNIRMQYDLQAEAVSKKLEEIKASVTADGFKGLLSEVRKKWEYETTQEFKRVQDKFGQLEPPTMPNDKVWEEITKSEWEKVVKKLDEENKKKTATRDKKKALEEKARLIQSEAVLNNPRSLIQAIGRNNANASSKEDEDPDEEDDEFNEEEEEENDPDEHPEEAQDDEEEPAHEEEPAEEHGADAG